MELGEVLQHRHMTRHFETVRSVPTEVVDRVVGLGMHAPSAGFSQGWHFLVLDQPDAVAAYWNETADPTRVPDPWLRGLRSAPVLVAVFSERAAYERRYAHEDKVRSDHAPRDLGDRWPVAYWDIDAGTAAGYMLLAAADAGLGACWFAVPVDRVEALRQRFDVPDAFMPVGVVALGYPDPDRRPGRPAVSRRPWSEVVSYDSFGARRGTTVTSGQPSDVSTVDPLDTPVSDG